MNIYFITGGFGFLGQYIVQAIHEHDPQGELRVLTRTQRRTFLDLQKLERVKWVRGELTQPESFMEHLAGVDTVIHNAAMVSFVRADAQKVFDANVIGTRNLAQAARKAAWLAAVTAARVPARRSAAAGCGDHRSYFLAARTG